MRDMPLEKFTRIYKGSEVIFEESSVGFEMYIVHSGDVQLTKRTDGGQAITLAQLREGDFFGEMAIIDGSPRSAQATAGEDGATLIALDMAKFLYLIQQQPEFALTIMRTLCQRIRESNIALAREGARQEPCR